VPAAAVIPAPVVYANVAAVKTLVVNGKVGGSHPTFSTAICGAGGCWSECLLTLWLPRVVVHCLLHMELVPLVVHS